MKSSRKDVGCKAHAVPKLKSETQSLTSFAGLVGFQVFFARIELKARLGRCFAHLSDGKVYCRATLFLQLMLHLLLGYRELRDARYYGGDPLVKRLLGLRRLPDVATISRMLRDADAKSVAGLRGLLRDLLFTRLQDLRLARITLDFDGSVQSTTRRAEGTAVGFNKKKKGARSYYPLFCTIAQTGQVLDFLHRSGNVHDSHGAREFILACIQSAFFSDEIVMALDEAGIEFSVSVPFERFVELKGKIQRRKRWRRLGGDVAYFEEPWKPKVWNRRFRFLFLRTRAKRTPLWAFEYLHTFRSALIQRAGRLTRPHGKLTLTISANHWIKSRLLNLLKRLHNAA